MNNFVIYRTFKIKAGGKKKRRKNPLDGGTGI